MVVLPWNVLPFIVQLSLGLMSPATVTWHCNSADTPSVGVDEGGVGGNEETGRDIEWIYRKDGWEKKRKGVIVKGMHSFFGRLKQKKIPI